MYISKLRYERDHIFMKYSRSYPYDLLISNVSPFFFFLININDDMCLDLSFRATRLSEAEKIVLKNKRLGHWCTFRCEFVSQRIVTLCKPIRRILLTIFIKQLIQYNCHTIFSLSPIGIR